MKPNLSLAIALALLAALSGRTQTAGLSPTVDVINTLGVITNVPAEVVAAASGPASPNPNPLEVSNEIRAESAGAIADYGLLKVRFTPNLAESRPVTISARGGQAIAFRPAFIVLVKRTTGETWIVGQLTNSVLQVGPSDAVYPSAFDTTSADLRYCYNGSRLEQFLTLREKIVLPKELEGSEADLDLECWTEFFLDNQPVSVRETAVMLRAAQPGLSAVEATDQSTDLGGLRIPDAGKAFSVGEEQDTIPVAKTWIDVDGAQNTGGEGRPPRRFLSERTDWLSLKPKLDKLPAPSGHASIQLRKSNRALLARMAPAPAAAPGASAPVVLASSAPSPKTGVVIDFAVAAPEGLIAWWKGEGDAMDSKGACNGQVQGGMGYAAGMVGQGFNLDGSDDWVSVDSAPPLNFAAGADFSIEGWIKPFTTNTTYGVQMILDKRQTTQLDDGAVGYALYLIDGRLCCMLADGPLLSYAYSVYGPVGPDLRTNGNYHHIALTVDRDSTNGLKLYVDGSALESFNPTTEPGDLSTNAPVRIGKHASSGVNAPFKGIIDELSIYNKALSEAEVQAIFNAGADGKTLPPVITTQPASLSVAPGADATFTVAATGAGLTYQWRLNGQNISGATASSYTRSNVQLSDQGNYSVAVSNPAGTAVSADAILTVSSGGACAFLPYGLVSWWRAEGNAADETQLNPGTLMNGAWFTAGKVLQGFNLDGASRYVRVPSSPSLCLAQEFTIECWYNDTGSSWFYGLISKRQNTAPYTTTYGINIWPNQVVQLYFLDPAYGSWQVCSYSPVPPPNVFHHIAGTFKQLDSTNVEVKLYIDGVCVNTVTRLGNLANCQNDVPVTLGASYEGGEYLVGVIDEASIYNRALSAAEIQRVYNAGVAGKCLDGDSDTLPDWWEMRYFGSVQQNPTNDLDADGLTNLEEYQLGYDPTNSHTGGSNAADGDKDYDNDGLSNLAELRIYHSNPASAHTFSSSLTDAEYLFAAHVQLSGAPAPPLAKAKALWLDLHNGLLQFTITEANPGSKYELYFANNMLDYDSERRWRWRRVFSGILCDANGSAIVTIPKPDPNQGYFVILAAEDADDDGLSDGYEAWFNYTGKRTLIDKRDSDIDGMDDGWEVAYGLEPTSSSGQNGPSWDPDLDEISNFTEFTNNEFFTAPSYDPLKPYGSTTEGSTARPVVSVTSHHPYAESPGGTATFTIHRSIGLGANLSKPLTVYYSVGGTAVYLADYDLKDNLNPPQPPAGYPRIFSATIQAGQADVTITVKPLTGGMQSAGVRTVVIKLTPFGVGAETPIQEPRQWEYVTDVYHQTVTIEIWNGILINLERSLQNGYLRIKPLADSSPLPFINVANSGKGTVARIYTGADPVSDPSIVVGEYLSAPDGRPRNPSRTTVDRYGNVWVGNRDEIGDDGLGGSVAELGIVIGGTRCSANGVEDADGEYLKPPFIYNTCIDRNRDDLIHTSRGRGLQLPWPNVGSPGPDSAGGVSTAQDEAILRYVRVRPTAVRTIAVDTNNNVWVGSYDQNYANRWHQLVDTKTGTQITGWSLNFQAGGYGGVVDNAGALWSSGYDNNSGALAGLLRFQPGPSMPVSHGGSIRLTSDGYGIGIDPSSGDAWQPLYHGFGLMQFRTDHARATIPMIQRYNRGVAIDGRRNIWVGGDQATIFHLTTAGVQIGAVPVPYANPFGVTIDSRRFVWAICCQQAGYAVRIDPNRGDVPPGADRPIGEVVESVSLGDGSLPYNYSDMSGFVTLSASQPSGVWDHVEEASTVDALWTSITMDADTPTDTRVVVELRAANSITELPSWPFVAVVNAGGYTPNGTTTVPPTLKGRFLEVRANLERKFGVTESPELRSLTIEHGAAAAAVQITVHPKSVVAIPGQNVELSVTGQVPPGQTATYRWLKDGTPLFDGENIYGVTTDILHVNGVSYRDAARYSLRMGIASDPNLQIESAPARLHVRGSPPDLEQDLPSSPLVCSPGQSATFTARATAGLNPGERPIFYQWRFNNEPIVGGSGTCSGSPCITTFNVPDVQCQNVGVYSVIFWNQYGQISTINQSLTIGSPLAIQPPAVIVSTANKDNDVALSAVTCLGDIQFIQWYLTTPSGKTPVAGANSLLYTIPAPITCEKLGTYTVVVANGNWDTYEASVVVSGQAGTATVEMSSTTLHITPENIGTGVWAYQWSRSADDQVYTQIPGATAETLVLPLDPNEAYTDYYQATATRSGAAASLKVFNYSKNPRVYLFDKQNAELDVTYAAQVTGDVWAYQWYFTPSGSSFERSLNGAVENVYTANAVECESGGTYRLRVNCSGVGVTADLDVPLYARISDVTVQFKPADIGTGTWAYSWFVSDDGGQYQPILPNPGTAYYALPPEYKYYQVLATRTQAQASARFTFYNGGFNSVFLSQLASDNGTLAATVVSRANLNITDCRWYFKSDSTQEEYYTGNTSTMFTIDPINCEKAGWYTAKISDRCGRVAEATLLLYSCP